jgi:hypothetical protein
VLASTGLRVVGSGVFWPSPTSADATLVAVSDHRAVWIDVMQAE